LNLVLGTTINVNLKIHFDSIGLQKLLLCVKFCHANKLLKRLVVQKQYIPLNADPLNIYKYYLKQF